MTLGLFGGMAPASAAVVDVSAGATPLSPVIAADAPWTKTVTWLVSKMTPAEKVLIVEKSTDPDNHGQAGYLAPVPRLGIPEIRHVDAMGVNVKADTTAFPTRLGLASSFDRSAYTDLGVQVGQESLAADIDLIYGPQVDLARFPSWSRNLTTNGEDAYLSSQFAATEIEGIQSTGEMSQVKHVSFYNGQAQATPSLIGSQSAHELYLLPAQAAIEDAGVSSVMCSYATFQIVGEESVPNYACSNSNLQNNILKGQFGLKGFITSDYTASKATSDILAGMDNEFATSNLSAANLKPLIDPTSSTYNPLYVTATNNAVARMVYQYERFGLLDNDHIPAAYRSDVPQHGDVDATHDNSTSLDLDAGSAVALDLAERSGVLLKNDNAALPLSKAGTVAVVGPTATLMPSSPGGERARGYGVKNTFTPLKAIQTEVGPAKVTSAPGLDWIGTTVPSTNLSTTNDASAVPGLTRTTTDANNVVTTSVDTTLNGKQTNLVKGNKYSWTGYINVTTADTYQLLIQRPYGTDSGVPTQYNKGVSAASAGAVTLAVDGTTKTLANPGGNILQNDFPDGDLAANGQYLGKDNTGVSLDLTVGLHQVTLTYNPVLTAATTPTLRFAWAPLNQNIAAAAAAATTNDQTVVFVDDSSPGTTAGAGPNSSTSAALRNLNANQVTLINTVAAAAHAAGHKVTVVLNSGTAVSTAWADNVDALLEMWYPGQEGGTATSNLLYGKVNPSGRLPMTFPVDDDHTPFSGHVERTTGNKTGTETVNSIKWNDGIYVGYRWYTDPAVNTTNATPRYAFGYGLSYTTFDYSNLSAKSSADGGLDVTFTVKNTGTKAGGTAPQIYLGASPDLVAPTYDANGIVTAGFEQSKEKLVQFDHVTLAAGESTTLTLHVNTQQLSGWDTVAQNWVLGTGNRAISLGAASNDIKQTITKNIASGLVAPAVTTDLAASTSASVGSTVTLTAAASGTPVPSVRWQSSTDGGATFADIAGQTSGTLTVPATVATSGNPYPAVFSNDLGDATTTATTVHVALTDIGASQFTADIQWLVDNHITTGNPDGTFGPAQNISRQALIAWLWRFEHPGQADPTVTVAPFTDVPVSNEFAGAIAWAKAEGITTGTNGKFSPGATVTRQDVAIFLYRAVKHVTTVPSCTAVPFPDVSKNAPSCGAIAWLKTNRVTTGWTDGTFKPALPIARDAVAAWLHRASAI